MSKILLGASASAALYKCCDLTSKLTQAGHQVRVILTGHAAQLIRPQLFEAISGQPTFTDEFDPGTRHSAMDHIELGAWGELLVVAPASANLIGKLANGIADDMLSTLNLALPASRPRLLAPAMNAEMLVQPAVQRNLEQLASDGWSRIDSEVGHLACGTEGPGRLAEPAEIFASIQALLDR